MKKQNQSRPSAGNPKSEYLNPKQVKEDTVLKKQSQFVPGQNSTTSYLKGDYENNLASGTNENKANQTQLQRDLQQVKQLRGRIATAVRAM